MKKFRPRIYDSQTQIRFAFQKQLRHNKWTALLFTPLLVLAFVLISGNLLFAQDEADTSNKIYLPVISSGNTSVDLQDAPPLPDTYDSQQEPAIEQNENSGRLLCLLIYLKFTNQSNYPVNVYYVDLFGRESLYKALKPGSYYYQLTSFGNRWRVRSSSGSLLKDFSVFSCFTTYITISNSDFPATPTPTRTNTPVPPTATRTPTNTPIPPTATPTQTSVPATPTNTPVLPTATPTNTPLPLQASLGNQVWFDLNGNGTQEFDEPYVSNVTVELLQGCVGSTVLQTQITDANGFYTFFNLTPDQYRVRFSNIPAGYQFTAKNVGFDDVIDSDVNPDGTTDCITLASGAVDPFEDAGIVTTTIANSTINGVAWYDANFDGIQDGGEARRLDVLMLLYSGCTDTTHIVGSQVTDLDGIYSFVSIPAGQYRVATVQDANFPISPKDQTVDSFDSDFDAATGLSDCISFSGGETLSLDVGFFPVN